MPITYGPLGSSYAVKHGDRVVQRCASLLGAEVAATRLTGKFGGQATYDPGPAVVPADGAPPPPPDFADVLGLSIPKLRARLEEGDLDDHLTALEVAERGRTDRDPRSGAFDAIADRRDEAGL